jgi:protein-ribulosamine 3-kinase
MLPDSVKNEAVRLLRSITDTSLSFEKFSSVGGGCINHGGQLKTSGGSYFIKWNDAQKYPGMFEAEGRGLSVLHDAKAIHIPKVLAVGETNDEQFIVLELIEASHQSKDYWETLGHQLAALHRHTNTHFGLDHQNYIGSLRQYNDFADNWINFFIEKRLIVQLELASANGHADASLLKKFDRLFQMLPSIFPKESPALLHGDLWSGNLITDNFGNPCLIDPAVYYGHREAELAFTTLFGGFDKKFYEAYQEAFPMGKRFDERVDIYNLYPLLVHVNLFGGHYVNQVKSILNSIL